MKDRNEFLEMDGLFWESETHEWFNDRISTQYARKNSVLWGSGEQKDGLNVMCFFVRNKETGEYDRVMMDKGKNEVIFETKSLEAMGYEIDRMKIQKRFEDAKE
jgi:hypothetical protein